MKSSFVVIIAFLFSVLANAQMNSAPVQPGAPGLQKKINLDDIQIKGEAQNKGLNVLARQKNSLDGRITLRTNYHDEILSEMPVGYIPVKYIKNPGK